MFNLALAVLGNAMRIPEAHRPPGSEAPPFRVDLPKGVPKGGG